MGQKKKKKLTVAQRAAKMERQKEKQKRKKLTGAQKAEKARRRKMYKTVFIHGKQKRVLREEWVAFDDPIFLHQMEMWELIPMDGEEQEEFPTMIDINSGRIERRSVNDV